jgi:hypothetical protein
MQTLTPTQIGKLDRLESIILHGEHTFIEVGNALCIIREEKLYLRDFDSFEIYCKTKWGFSKQRGIQLIQAAELVDGLPPTLAAGVANERDARALLALPPAHQKEAIREAKQEGVSVAEKAKSFSEKPESIGRSVATQVATVPQEAQDRQDAVGRVIPPGILADWDRAVKVGNHLRSLASEIKVTVERGLADKDIIYGEILNPTISEAISLHYTLSQILPHAVCPTCQGKLPKTCVLCRKRGWISKYLFNSPSVSQATKAIISKVAK